MRCWMRVATLVLEERAVHHETALAQEFVATLVLEERACPQSSQKHVLKEPPRLEEQLVLEIRPPHPSFAAPRHREPGSNRTCDRRLRPS